MNNLIRSIKKHKLQYLINIILVVAFLLPIGWTISTSLKPTNDITQLPPEWIPENITLNHYKKIFTFENGIFSTYFINSVLLTTLTVSLVVVISALAGYGFSKLDIPFGNLFKMLILLALMIPFQTLLVPLYSLIDDLGILNTRIALVFIYVTFFLPFGVFMMTNSFDSVPSSLRESALLDGANELETFLKVYLPLGLPGLATTAVYAAYRTWNDFIVALIFATSNELRPLNVGLSVLAVGKYGTSWGLLTAGVIISILPMMILYAFLQKYFVAGLTSGSVK
ncbi:ABC-type sugar transport system, permease component [Halobacteroides halobius DSM 5150]|uniref:ABC-type sugar transport system, permease component n=1 Tax=Halobacteroides halobius (strain ATCC 35273 / DSM 5150 / MD-1) TaxID=748449 RepID=L0KBC3_HALHC|nr:carbohydrate ABC transporter permease [Halobacteroides halobius]AGB41684.1 ABC-type sugar transport system, permease component [Halobacteroides halobius DSM 5150]